MHLKRAMSNLGLSFAAGLKLAMKERVELRRQHARALYVEVSDSKLQHTGAEKEWDGTSYV
jgi:hypothetical protein